ncbi:MAG: PAS domain S-box protein [Epsilonproteobacteria bacterium]|nr:PAS domain S-box protein [Campylobacterota bacterium]
MLANTDFSILLICDDSDQRDFLVGLLEAAYQNVYIAINDEDAYSQFKMFPIDLIIKYVRKYQKGDLEIIQKCRDIDDEIPIFALYSLPKIEFFNRSVELGVDRIFPIPINESMLMRALLQYCNNKTTQRMLLDQIKLLDEYKEALDRSFLVSKADSTGKITHVNENFCKVSGYSKEELIGQNHSILKHPETKDEVYKEMWGTILSQKLWRGRIKNRAKNGEEYVVESVISPIVGSDGEITEFISIRQDVTQFIKAGRMVIEQEKEKKEMEKEHYRAMNKTKDDFLVVFTHELKTPLNAIINFSNSASKRIQKIDTPKKDSLIEMMKVIKSNGYDMLQTINNILDLSRLKSNRLEYKKDKFTLEDIFEDLLSRFAVLIEEGGVHLDLKKENLDLELVMDQFRTTQIISNILSNAIKYSHKEVLIFADIQSENLILTIEDNGPGIENKEKIFDLYEQEDDDGIKRASKGTGIGLHFVKLLCEGMSVDLKLEDSKKLGGTKFTFGFALTDAQKERVVHEEDISC